MTEHTAAPPPDGALAPVAVVSGASSGIGAATARALADAGHHVVLVARGSARLEEVAAEIRAAGGAATVEALDAADGEAVVAMADRVTAQLGVPDVVINSAGAGVWRFIEDTPPDAARAMMDAPYLAAFNLSHAFMQGMLERGRGVLIHVNSPASQMPWPSATGYTAARWALRGLHEALSQDLVGTGVHSVHVVFGKVTSNYFANNPDSEERLPAVANLVPVTTPEQCARVIMRAVRRPTREIIYPFTLRLFYWSSLMLPPVVRWLGARTGRRHGK